MQPESIIGLFVAENPGVEVLETLGAGATGVVFKCRQRDLARTVAVKVMQAELPENSLESRSRFHREAKILSGLVHSGLPKFYSFGMCQNQFPYIVMEFIDGCSLAELLNQQPRLPWDQVSSLALQLCSLMTYLHKEGVRHRDLSPGNILLESGRIEKDSVRLIDFGLAARLDLQKLTQTGDILGTPQYMSPEVCNGRQATPASDVYSLGCILYRCLSGGLPHQASNLTAMMVKHTSVEPASLPKSVVNGLPRGLESVVLTCLAKDPAARYSSMVELARDIELCRDGLPPNLTPAVAERLARRRVALNGSIALLIVGLLVVLLQWRSVVTWSAAELPLVGTDPLRTTISSGMLKQLEEIGDKTTVHQFRVRMLQSSGQDKLEAARLCLRFATDRKLPGRERREWLVAGFEQLPLDQPKQALELFESLCKLSAEVVTRPDDRFEWQVRKVIDAMRQWYSPEAMPVAYGLVSKFILAHLEPRREDAKYLLAACEGMIGNHLYAEVLTLTEEMDRYFKRYPSMVKNTLYSLQLRLVALHHISPERVPEQARKLTARALNSEDPDTQRALCSSCDTLVSCGETAEAERLVPQLERLLLRNEAGTPTYKSLVLLRLRKGEFADAEALARKFLLTEPEKDDQGEVLHEFLAESLVGQHRCKEAAGVLISLLQDREFRLLSYHFGPAVEKVQQCTGEDVKAELERIKKLMQQRRMDLPMAEAAK